MIRNIFSGRKTFLRKPGSGGFGNPAADWVKKQGLEYKNVTDINGSQKGMVKLPNSDRWVSDWSYFRKTNVPPKPDISKIYLPRDPILFPIKPFPPGYNRRLPRPVLPKPGLPKPIPKPRPPKYPISDPIYVKPRLPEPGPITPPRPPRPLKPKPIPRKRRSGPIPPYSQITI